MQATQTGTKRKLQNTFYGKLRPGVLTLMKRMPCYVLPLRSDIDAILSLDNLLSSQPSKYCARSLANQWFRRGATEWLAPMDRV